MHGYSGALSFTFLGRSKCLLLVFALELYNFMYVVKTTIKILNDFLFRNDLSEDSRLFIYFFHDCVLILEYLNCFVCFFRLPKWSPVCYWQCESTFPTLLFMIFLAQKKSEVLYAHVNLL